MQKPGFIEGNINSHSTRQPQPEPTGAQFIEIALTPQQARAILKHNTSPNILVMCRGYNDCAKQFTELVWPDDADLDFEDQASYPEFQLWVDL